MFQCNKHVEMKKFLCSLACTWMTIIYSQFYFIDSLSLDVSLEWNANLVVAWLKFCLICFLSADFFQNEQNGGPDLGPNCLQRLSA